MRCSPRRALTLLLALPAGLLWPVEAQAALPASALARARASVVTVDAPGRQGTAFAFGARGRFITNAHVLGGASIVTLIAPDGHRAKGRLLRLDGKLDLAELRAPLTLAPLRATHRRPAVGEAVYAIGAPFGLEGSLSSGIVSALRDGAPHGADIQSDVPLNPGNSGGPLLDAQGRVLGVNESKLSQGSGISFSIPIGDVAALRRMAPLKQLASKSSSGIPSWQLILAGVLAAAMLLVLGFAAGRRGRRRGADASSAPRPPLMPPRRFEPDQRVTLKREQPVEQQPVEIRTNRD